MNANVTVNLRILVDRKSVPWWRIRLLGRVARWLRVPLRVDDTDPVERA